jgi:hypothetical protein
MVMPAENIMFAIEHGFTYCTRKQSVHKEAVCMHKEVVLVCVMPKWLHAQL